MCEDEDTKDNISGLTSMGFCISKIAFHLSSLKAKRKEVPLQAWSGPEGSRKLSFPDYLTTAQDCGKVVSLTHRPPLYPQEIYLVLISVRG